MMSTKFQQFQMKKERLGRMTKRAKLRMESSGLGYAFFDAKKGNFFGQATSLDDAIAFLEKRFPQLKEVI